MWTGRGGGFRQRFLGDSIWRSLFGRSDVGGEKGVTSMTALPNHDWPAGHLYCMAARGVATVSRVYGRNSDLHFGQPLYGMLLYIKLLNHAVTVAVVLSGLTARTVVIGCTLAVNDIRWGTRQNFVEA